MLLLVGALTLGTVGVILLLVAIFLFVCIWKKQQALALAASSGMTPPMP